MPISQQDNAVTVLTSSPLTLSTSWQYINTVNTIFSQDRQVLGLWLDIDINDSQGLQLKMICSGSDDLGRGVYQTDEFYPLISSPSSNIVKLQQQLWEFTENIDQKVVLGIPTVDLAPQMRFLAKVTTVGANPGQILSSGVSSSSNL